MMTPSSNSSFKEISGLFVPRKRFAGSSNLIPSYVERSFLISLIPSILALDQRRTFPSRRQTVDEYANLGLASGATGSHRGKHRSLKYVCPVPLPPQSAHSLSAPLSGGSIVALSHALANNGRSRCDDARYPSPLTGDLKTLKNAASFLVARAVI